MDADGSPRAYGPGGKGLDFLANAGNARDGWWGIVTEDGEPVVQGPNDPAPGFYVSTTSYQRREFDKSDPRRYVDSETEIFAVVPKHWRQAIPGVVLGCRVTITDTRSGAEVEGVVADFGPKGHVGEASIAAALALGLSGNPKNGGSESPHYRYTFWPDVPADGYELQPM